MLFASLSFVQFYGSVGLRKYHALIVGLIMVAAKVWMAVGVVARVHAQTTREGHGGRSISAR